MKEKTYFLNSLLAIFTGVALLAAMMVRIFVPIAFIPEPGIPELVLFSLVVLLAEHYLKKAGKRCYLCVFLLSAVTFGLLPWMAGFVTVNECGKAALVGGLVFTATTWIFSSMEERMNSCKSSKVSPIVNALGLYLAVQGLMGMFL